MSDNILQSFFPFQTTVYSINKPEYLDVTTEVCNEYLVRREQISDLNEIYPVYQTENFMNDSRLVDFNTFILNAAWQSLNEQGYLMEHFVTYFTSMWCQEHYKYSGMDRHIHGYGSQIVGFYFIETPEKCSTAIFHDPRDSKVLLNLPKRKIEVGTIKPSDDTISFNAMPGRLLFSNAWLPHSFSRSGTEEPMKFIHFNIGVKPRPIIPSIPAGEVI